MGIRHRSSRSRSAWLLAALLAPVLAALTLLAPAALAQSPPGTPSSVTVARADGTLTATWPAVSGATSYHVTYSDSGGQGWQLAALDHASTSITIAVDNAKTYTVGVRAKNDVGGGGWRNSPAAGPYTPPPDAVASIDGAQTASQNAPGLTATVHGDKSVDLAISNHQGNWWFKINSWGTCTAVNGSTINGIQGYKPGTHTVWAYSDSNCGAQMAATTFTISAASLTATVNSDSSVDLTMSNGPSPWYFRIGIGSCTTVTGATISGIKGYAPGYHEATAFATAGCTDFLTDAYFVIPDPPQSNATLATTVSTGPSVNLTLTNGPSNNYWWFRINSWGTCTAVAGTDTVNNIQGYQPGTHAVDAYSDGGCHTKIASSSFTIPQLALATTVSNDRSVALTLTGGPTDWWFKIGWWGTCTAATGTTVSNIRGYQPGTHSVAAHSDGGCADGSHIAAGSFTIPTATLTATVNTDRSVALTLIGGPSSWWFRINWWGTCTAASGDTVSNIQGYQPGIHAVAAYSDGGCNYHVAAATFDLYSLSASSITPTTATLTLAGHFGDWWLKETAPSTGTCTAGESDYSHALSNLSAGTDYTYKAYSDSACATTALHTVSFTTTPVGVSNLSETSTSGSPSTSGGAWIASEFATGSNTNGYTVSEVTVPISPGSGGSNLTLRIFSKPQGAAIPGSSLVTLTNTGDTNGNYTFSCSGTGCDLEADKSYFLVLNSASGYSHAWAATASNNETGSAGWRIGDTYTASLDSGSSWTPDANTRVTKFSITATPK